MMYYVRKLKCYSSLSLFQNVHQIPIFLQIMRTMKMIKIMKIIQWMKMKVTTEHTNTCSKSTVEKKFWCLYDKLWTYVTPCSSVFNVGFEHVIIYRVVFYYHKHQRFYVFCIENLIFLLSFLKNDCLLKIFFWDLIHILNWFKWP